jgi:DNA polymerase I-like protein with 3'-5' exonuclease and polymerase domains
VGLSKKLDISLCDARGILALHRKIFPAFWEWTERIGYAAMLRNELRARFGWRTLVSSGWDEKRRRPNANLRSLRNFPCQANGSEMMRWGCILVTEAGIQVDAVIHDALLIEAPMEDIEATTKEARRLMTEASELILPGFPVRTDSTTVRYPDRYMDKRGEVIWPQIERLLGELPASPPDDFFADEEAGEEWTGLMG